MQIILHPRGSGKTEELIRMSAQNNWHIVVLREEAHRVFARALELKLDIPFPITFDEFIEGRFYPPGISGLLIDNADLLLNWICKGKVPIFAATISLTSEEYRKE